MNGCHICGVPLDAGVFDVSTIIETKTLEKELSAPGQEVVLVRYELPRNYCGTLLHFAQFTDRIRQGEMATRGYQWQIRSSGQPLYPYLTLDHIVNPWGMAGFPIHLRLEEGCAVELVIRNVGGSDGDNLKKVGGRILGRYWYNTNYGGAPDRP